MKRKNIFTFFACLLLVTAVAWVLCACNTGGSHEMADEKVTLKISVINNENGYVFLGSEDENAWSTEVSRGNDPHQSCWIWVKRGYQHQNVNLYLDGQKIDIYDWKSNSVNGTEEDIIDLIDYVNLNGTYLKYMFPDAKQDHELVVDAQNVTGYLSTVTLELDDGYLVTKTNDNYHSNQFYFGLDNIVVPTATANQKQMMGAFGEKLLILSEQERPLNYIYWNAFEDREWETGLPKMKVMGEDYKYRYNNQEYYVYPYTFEFKDTTISEYHETNGIYVDPETELFGIKVVNKTEPGYGYYHVTGYTDQEFATDEYLQVYYGDTLNETKYYAIPRSNDINDCDVYYLYTGRGEPNGKLILSWRDWYKELGYPFGDAVDSQEFNQKYLQTLTQVKFFITAGQDVDLDDLKISFQNEAGEIYIPQNNLTKRKVKITYPAAAMDNVAVYEIDLDKTALQGVLAMFDGENTDRYLFLVVEPDATKVPYTQFTIVGNHDHSGVGSLTPSISIVGPDVNNEGVLYEAKNAYYVQSMVLDKYLVAGNQLKVRVGEGFGTINNVPYYQSAKAVIKNQAGQILMQSTNFAQSEYEDYLLITFDNLAKLAGHKQLTIELQLTQKLQKTLDLASANRADAGGKILWATNYQGEFRDLSELTTINDYVYIKFTDPLFSTNLRVVYRQDGQSDVTLADCYALQDIFGSELHYHDTVNEYMPSYYYLKVADINIKDFDSTNIFIVWD